MNITLPFGAIAAAALALAPKDNRPYMSCIHIDAAGVVMGTDGHRMHLVRVPVEGLEGIPAEGLAIRPDPRMLRAVRWADIPVAHVVIAGNLSETIVRVEVSGPTGAHVVWQTAPGAHLYDMRGTHPPQWRQIIKRVPRPSPEPVTFNTRYYNDMTRAAEMVSGKRLLGSTLLSAGHKEPALFMAREATGFLGVLMPVYRAGGDALTHEDFAAERTAFILDKRDKLG